MIGAERITEKSDMEESPDHIAMTKDSEKAYIKQVLITIYISPHKSIITPPMPQLSVLGSSTNPLPDHPSSSYSIPSHLTPPPPPLLSNPHPPRRMSSPSFNLPPAAKQNSNSPEIGPSRTHLLHNMQHTRMHVGCRDGGAEWSAVQWSTMRHVNVRGRR